MSGIYYTRPQLAVPTVQRTLRPLAYGRQGTLRSSAPSHSSSPRKPEAILGLRVCDPACGSGSFLIAALRFLTEAVYESLFRHDRLDVRHDRTDVWLTGERKSNGSPGSSDEIIPCRPADETFESRLKSKLKRYVVERCIYGVDIDPIAIELCRLSLWIETMDRELPFTFLDHKIKAGNSLVGCWFDWFRHYPVMAWERQGGDRNHVNGVHFTKGVSCRAIRRFRRTIVKPEMIDWIRGQGVLFEQADGASPEVVHDHAMAELESIHRLPLHHNEQRSWMYEGLRAGGSFDRLKRAFDAWCAIWFWPANGLEACPTPANFAHPKTKTLEVVERLAEAHRFFHWELEFPDVFTRPGGGFDAIVGNPPWDVAKPNSKEFFSRIDPLYRAYGKQEALHHQKQYFTASVRHEREWLDYNAYFKAFSNWLSYAGEPFGDRVVID